MKKTIIIRLIFLILMLSTFIMIFGFSSQNATESKTLSRKVMRAIVDIYPKTKKLSELEKNKVVKQSQQFIRKTAHFTIYMTLGIMATGFLNTYEMNWKNKSLIIIIISFLYAISDEIHQGITGGGRAPQIFDVYIDTLGALFGITIVFIIIRWQEKVLQKKRKKL